ncbi:hypothetical protein Syn7803C97_16 [Synechococcus phage S-MbCM6]|jgi:hypothetical protein|uniref:Uncharacterized protein n=3 Tax=Namakavirus smbcm6 TaxID=2734120 RepID=H8ZMC1_9CAUD|nr:hypothetical protein [Synechococcus phage ACG-2014c]AHB80650.1 hypothetical protein S-MbCM25_015 [Synechococcus phage S-MbCM25]AFD02632.1 hypothetical protein [Synechococcus phage ACG-2014c]AIX14409.1 hypothetical protein Syn7803C43_14 [Synechococcus phage ACG-2014c]AIX22569.1 hypothetical protein Syn7803C97_16 [Synechococcus phage ACG-2014c]AIX22783.1 hypothetical protein Syn7803C98_15 [Synechococcus phage ACG-2014c]
MSTDLLEHININFSKRSVTITSSDGDKKTVVWKWDREGSEGFAETVSLIESMTDPEIRTYQFAEQ